MVRSYTAIACALALGVALTASSATAGSITFKNFVNQDNSSSAQDWIDFVVTVHDDTPGKFTITVAHTASSPNIGDITGVYFDVYEGLTPANAQITKVIGDIASVAKDTNKLPSGTGVNPIPAFDLGIQYFGLSYDDLQLVSFTMSDLGFLTLDHFTRFGVRAQSVAPASVDRSSGNGLGGSTKEYTTYSERPQEPPVVPLPAAAWGGLALMSFLGVTRIRRRRAAM